MAEKVPGAAPRKRGRPSNAEIAARKASLKPSEAVMQEAADKAAGKTTSPPAAKSPAKIKEQAPGFGHNAPDESVFLRHVHSIQQHVEGPLEQAKAKVKEEKGKLKDLRQLAKADGLVLKELDEAVEDARTERVDLVAKETRRRLYRQWLGLPFEQGDLFEENEATPSLAREQLRWKAIGNTLGRLGKPRVAPDDCPANMESHLFAGYDEGQAALMKALPLTAGAFNADGSLKSTTASEPPAGGPETAAEGDSSTAAPPADDAASSIAVVILGRGDFTAETTDLDDANRSTLASDALRERFDAAERVVAVFDGKRRIIKEPGYVDDGVGELSDVEDAAPEEVAAVETDASPEATLAEDIDEAKARIEEQRKPDQAAFDEPDDGTEIPGERPLEETKVDPGSEFH